VVSRPGFWSLQFNYEVKCFLRKNYRAHRRMSYNARLGGVWFERLLLWGYSLGMIRALVVRTNRLRVSIARASQKIHRTTSIIIDRVKVIIMSHFTSQQIKILAFAVEALGRCEEVIRSQCLNVGSHTDMMDFHGGSVTRYSSVMFNALGRMLYEH